MSNSSGREVIHLVRPDEQAELPDLIMLIRHGEKPGYDDARGVLPDGKHDTHSLTVHGWVRAGALIELFAPTHGEPPGGLRRPDSIYAASFSGNRSKRALETVFPLAMRLGLKVDYRLGHGDEKKLAKRLKKGSGAAVVSWHHEGIPKIIKHLGDVTPDPPAQWPEDRYDLVWMFTRNGEGWRFEQVPQDLIPGDAPYVIDEADAEDDDADDDADDDEADDARSG